MWSPWKNQMVCVECGNTDCDHDQKIMAEARRLLHYPHWQTKLPLSALKLQYMRQELKRKAAEATAAKLRAAAAVKAEQRRIAEQEKAKRVQEMRDYAARIEREQKQKKEQQIQIILSSDDEWLTPPEGVDPVIWAQTRREMAELLASTS